MVNPALKDQREIRCGSHPTVLAKTFKKFKLMTFKGKYATDESLTTFNFRLIFDQNYGFESQYDSDRVLLLLGKRDKMLIKGGIEKMNKTAPIPKGARKLLLRGRCYQAKGIGKLYVFEYSDDFDKMFMQAGKRNGNPHIIVNDCLIVPTSQKASNYADGLGNLLTNGTINEFFVSALPSMQKA